MVLRAPYRFDTAYEIDFLLDSTVSGKVVIDLSATNFIKPVGVVAILATLARLRTQSDVPGICLQLPRDQSVQSYLRMAGVFDVMREYGEFQGMQPEEVIPERNPVRPMVPCTHFHTSYDVEQLANRMEERFQTERIGPTSLLQTCNVAFSELAENVVHHAESHGGFVLAQQYNYMSGPMVEIAIADCGIGIRSSLQKNPAHSEINSDIDAVELAISEGVSSFEDRHRGYGLYHIRDDLKKRGRLMTIRSGQGILSIRGDGEAKATHHPVAYSGTIVNVIIPCE